MATAEITVRRWVVKRQLRRAQGRPTTASRIPRISRLMAIAIRFDEMLSAGEVKGFAELARIGQVSRSRISQVMNLLNLAPGIQEQLLRLPPMADGQERITERSLRLLLNSAHWAAQIKFWEDLKGESHDDSKAADVRVV